MQGDLYDLALIRDWASGFWDLRWGFPGSFSMKNVAIEAIVELFAKFKTIITRHRSEHALPAVNDKKSVVS